ncbi:MAG: RNA polymerase sigma factor [Acidimicrobiia bacterium]
MTEPVPLVVDPPLPTQPGTLYELFVDQHVAMIRMARLLTGSNEAAEDLVQDVFVRMHRKGALPDNAVAYLRTSVVNACRSWHRTRFRERARMTRFVEPNQVPLGARELDDALKTLSFRSRAALVLRFYEGWNEREIAEHLGVRPGTVGSLIHRGLDKLAIALGDAR